MPILYVLMYRYYCPWRQSSIEDGTLCENVSQLEAFNCSNSYLASIRLHLRCLTGFNSKCASESWSVWHYKDTSHCQIQPHSRLLVVYLKTPFFVKTKVKVGQMNWWTKLTNNIVIDSLYNIQNKQSSLPIKITFLSWCCSFVFVSWFSFSRSEASSIVKKCGAKIRGRMCLLFFCELVWPWIKHYALESAHV